MESAPEVVNIIDTLVIILQGGHADDDWFGAGYCHVHMFTQTVLMMSVNVECDVWRVEAGKETI